MEKVLRVEDGKYVTGEVIGAEVELMKLLWENPDPTAEFAAQTIALDLSGYDDLYVIYDWAVGNNYLYSQLVPIDDGRYCLSGAYPSGTASEGSASIVRQVTFGNSGIVFSDAGMGYTGSGRTTRNNMCIPLKIYGIKNKLQVIASDVSTSASKCMLSNGKGVEDVIDREYVEVTADGVKTSATLLNELAAILDYSKLTYNAKLFVTSTGVGTSVPVNTFTNNAAYFGYIVYASPTVFQGGAYEIIPNASRVSMGNITSPTDRSSTVPASGASYRIYY